jgi:hypothetical protein
MPGRGVLGCCWQRGVENEFGEPTTLGARAFLGPYFTRSSRRHALDHLTTRKGGHRCIDVTLRRPDCAGACVGTCDGWRHDSVGECVPSWLALNAILGVNPMTLPQSATFFCTQRQGMSKRVVETRFSLMPKGGNPSNPAMYAGPR